MGQRRAHAQDGCAGRVVTDLGVLGLPENGATSRRRSRWSRGTGHASRRRTGRSTGRERWRGLPRLGQEPVGRRHQGPPVDVRGRRRYGVVHDRAPQAQRGHAAAAGVGSRRGVRQLLPLCLPGARRRLAVRGGDGRRAVAAVARPSHPYRAEPKPAHLVFLVDVSGWMASPDKLPLAKQSLRILTGNLRDSDTVSLVTYAGSSRVVLPPTGIDHRAEILAAIDELSTGGATAMGSGIDLAYQQAMKGLVPGAISRVIVCTDGDANVGAHSHAAILALIAGRASEGVTLSTIGFGMGNYKDELMEQLADKGNGNNFYIDSLAAAHNVV